MNCVSVIAGVLLLLCCCGIDASARVGAAVGINGGGLSYWGFPVFANAMAQGQWLSVTAQGQWGTDYKELRGRQYLTPDQVMIRGIVYSLHATQEGPSLGLWTVKWKGSADIRANWGTYISSLSTISSSGTFTDGVRVYNCSTSGMGAIDIYNVDKNSPLTELYVMLPDPSQPSHRSLPEDTLFHPLYLQRARERQWQYYRTMDLTATNDSPVQDWVDRRKPSHVLQLGVLNPRSPAPSYQWASGNQSTGMSYEYIVNLANALDTNLWLNIPHLATDDFVRKLAQLVLYGSDGDSPYTKTMQHPVFSPLAENLDLYVEYSNEIWSSGELHMSSLCGFFVIACASNCLSVTV